MPERCHDHNWLTCTNDLKYDGSIGVLGICNHPGQVFCTEELAAANAAADAASGAPPGPTTPLASSLTKQQIFYI